MMIMTMPMKILAPTLTLVSIKMKLLLIEIVLLIK